MGMIVHSMVSTMRVTPASCIEGDSEWFGRSEQRMAVHPSIEIQELVRDKGVGHGTDPLARVLPSIVYKPHASCVCL